MDASVIIPTFNRPYLLKQCLDSLLSQTYPQEKFEIIISSVAAYPLDKSWVGRKIDKKFIEEMKKLQEKYKINPAGEGGEFESFVLNCPLFSRKLKVLHKEISGSANSWRMELEVL